MIQISRHHVPQGGGGGPHGNPGWRIPPRDFRRTSGRQYRRRHHLGVDAGQPWVSQQAQHTERGTAPSRAPARDHALGPLGPNQRGQFSGRFHGNTALGYHAINLGLGNVRQTSHGQWLLPRRQKQPDPAPNPKWINHGIGSLSITNPGPQRFLHPRFRYFNDSRALAGTQSGTDTRIIRARQQAQTQRPPHFFGPSSQINSSTQLVEFQAKQLHGLIGRARRKLGRAFDDQSRRQRLPRNPGRRRPTFRFDPPRPGTDARPCGRLRKQRINQRVFRCPPGHEFVLAWNAPQRHIRN